MGSQAYYAHAMVGTALNRNHNLAKNNGFNWGWDNQGDWEKTTIPIWNVVEGALNPPKYS